ncbi:MAG: ACP S-malonyltransferase [Candidatus Latescibacterota bacterium]|jgi:[acyl-carrier-protein] S-malonyltransferase
MGRCAFLFPGQASQYVGMARDLHGRYPSVRELFAQADACLGFSLSGVCFNGPEERLRQTAVTQPAVFVHGAAVWQLVAAAGVIPVAVAGHSLGEYVALVAAGALPLSDALDLVKARGRLMQQAGEERPGAMAAVIGLEDGRVEELCLQVQAEAGGEVVVPANYNAPGQVVVSGSPAGVERLGLLAREAGARKVTLLPVSGAFHSPLMQPAADRLREMLWQAGWQRPSVPVITNVAAAPVAEPDELRRQLVEQITHPVRWTESVQALSRTGVRLALELGPGSVLKGLVRRIDPELEVWSVGTVEELETSLDGIAKQV